jgi:outer membrane protein assembly factor BamD (BamD/ComL family)
MSYSINQMARLISLSLLMVLASLSIYAQEQTTVSEKPQIDTSGCPPEIFEEAEDLFSKRMQNGDFLRKAERQLKEVIQRCSDISLRYVAEDHLKNVQEELATHELNVAIFYIKRFRAGEGGKKGALARLNEIVKQYPQFSQMDKALSLLGELSIADDNLDGATEIYRRLIRDFPYSPYIGEAMNQLDVIEVMKVNNNIIP